MKPAPVELGQRYGRVVVVGLMQGPRQPNGRASGRQAVIRCDCGTVATVQARKLARATNATCGKCSGKAKRPADGIPGYVGAHHRVERARGKAREHACVFCGKPADHWALDITTSSPLYADREGRNEGLLYSTDLGAYWPTCTGCHGKLDALPSLVRAEIRSAVAWDAEHTRRGA